MKVDGDEIETRVLKGCVRIGYLANGLLLAGDKHVEMLVFCTDKPTLYMLQSVKSKFEQHLTVGSWHILVETSNLTSKMWLKRL